jgi:endogenous inhibitor of DNA gyrase (YacG/DUF329 family)
MLMHQDSQKKKMQKIDLQAWLTGKYVLNAIGVAFGEKKKNLKYPEQPESMKKKDPMEDFDNLSEEEQEAKFYETFRQKLRDWNSGIEAKSK